MKKYYKLPRIFLNHALRIGQVIEIDNPQNHYISNVLRLKVHQYLRIFNQENGEFLAEITGQSKKTTSVRLTETLRGPQNESGASIAFSLIKKQRQDFLIEKCTELGVKNFYPVLTDHCEVRKTNQEKLELQAIEAAEQCERLTLPKIENLQKLGAFLKGWHGTIYYGIEREKAPFVSQALSKASDSDIFLIGPEGGFSDKEKELLGKHSNAIGVNLGPNILRAETAAIMCASAWLLKIQA